MTDSSKEPQDNNSQNEQVSFDKLDYSQTFPLLPLRDVVVFPHMVLPLFVGREKSIAALEAAMEQGRVIALVAQFDATNENPGAGDVFDIMLWKYPLLSIFQILFLLSI